MAFLDLDTEYITEDVIQALSQETNITYLSPGSKARLLLDILNDRLSVQAQQFDDNVGKAFIRNAEGDLLDFIGEIFGTERYLEEQAAISKEEKNFFFYTLENSFGEINNFEDIIIPRGTVKVFNTNDNNQVQITYVNSEDIVLPSGENIVYFGAEAEGFGTQYNVGSNTMVFHSFKSYADNLNQSLKVNNDVSVTYGKDQESDVNYRFRIQQQTIAGEAANFSSIRLNLLAVPGVSDVIRIRYAQGIGTTNWLIKAVTPEVPQRLLTVAQQAINEKQGEGNLNKAIAPISIGVQLIFSVTYSERFEDQIKDEVKIKIRRDLISYINSLDVGENLIIDQLTRVVLSADERVSSIGPGNSEKNFDKINIYKRSSLSNTRVRKSLFRDYVAEEDERVIVEPSIIDPIVIVDNN